MNKIKLTSYIPQLDGIRAIAALLVMHFHFFQAYQIYGNTILNLIQKTSVFGQTGVSLFFVLSGFLITRILVAAKEEAHYFRNFYAKRVLRIFPLYYVFLLLFYFIIIPYFENRQVSFKDMLVYFTYLQNIFLTFSNTPITGPGHFWSLAVEEHFYLFWPLLVYLVNSKKVYIWLIGLICLSLLTRIIMVQAGYEVFYFTLTRLDDISLGALLAIIYLQFPHLLNFLKGKKFVVLIGIYFLLCSVLWYFTSGEGNPTMQVLKFLLIGLFYTLILGYIIINKSIFTKILATKPLIYLGKISYGLYVYHPVCYLVISHYFPSQNILINLFTHISSSILLSALSYEIFEKRFLKLKRYFSPQGLK
nr:acyltransferase [uncultured Carboxylicivirga sp.]